MIEIEKYKISEDSNIRAAIKKMDSGGIGFIYVADNNDKIIGIVTNGDFRRAVLNGISLKDNILKIINKKYIHLNIGYKKKDVQYIFNNTVAQQIPVLKNGRVIDIITEESFYGVKLEKKYNKMDIPVVIMAGGKGTRLAPFTNVLPKPLIPVGDKTIIEMIISEFLKYNIKHFFFTINFRGEMIRAYFDGIKKDYEIKYVQEKDFYGTAGSLKLIENEIDDTFIVSNCDILVKADYFEALKFHKKQNAYLTIFSSIQHFIIPFGVVKFIEGGEVIGIQEKPEYSFSINTGVYIIEKKSLKYIPENSVFNMTDLIKSLIKDGKKVVVYPIGANDYIDIGQWDEYKKAIESFKI